MKRLKGIFAVLFAALMTVCVTLPSYAAETDNTLSEIYSDANGRTMIVSRKGNFTSHPENSLAAIEAAVNDGADIVEIDIRMTADGTLILMEDDTVTRMCVGYGEVTSVSEMTYDDIITLNLLSSQGGHGSSETGEKIPSLDEVFASGYDCLYLLDGEWSLRDEIYVLAEQYDVLDKVIFYITDASADEINEWKSSLSAEPMIMTYFKGNVIFAASSSVKSASEVSGCIHLATKNPYGVIFGETVQNKAADSSIRTMASPCMPEICGKIMQDTSEWWDYLISCGFSMIMTDNVSGLREYLDRCDTQRAFLAEVYDATVTEWTLPDFKTDNYHDYKLAYTNAKAGAEAILSNGSNAYSDTENAIYELKKAYDDINANYDDFATGTAGMTVTPVRILLCVLAVAAVVCAEVYVYKKKKKS